MSDEPSDEIPIRARLVGDGTYGGTKLIDLRDGKELPVESLNISINEGYQSCHVTLRPELVDIKTVLKLRNDRSDPSIRSSMRILGTEVGVDGPVTIKVDPLVAWFAGLMQKALKEAREERETYPIYTYHQGINQIVAVAAAQSSEDDEYWDLAMARIALQCAMQADAMAKWHSEKLAKKSDRPEEAE